MAVQQQQQLGGGSEKPGLALGGSNRAQARPSKVDPSADVEAVVAMRRAGRAMNDRFGEYKGDLFATRGEYASSILYQSRMPIGGANDVQITGPLANRRSSAAGSPSAGGTFPPRRHSVIAHGEASYSTSAGALLATLQPQAGGGVASAPSSSSVAGGGGGGGSGSVAGSGAAAVHAARQLHHQQSLQGAAAGTVTFADGKASTSGGLADATASEADEAGKRQGGGDDTEDAEAGPRVQLLDAETIVTALSRGAHASTGFTLQLLDSAGGGGSSSAAQQEGGGGLQRLGRRAAEDEDLDDDGGITPTRLSLRQQCALALREMSRDPLARPAIVAQGGFRALLAVLIESEVGAEAEADTLADIVSRRSERAASIYGGVADERDGPPRVVRSAWASGVSEATNGGGQDAAQGAGISNVRQHIRRGVGSQTVLLRSDGGYAAAAAGFAGSSPVDGSLLEAPVDVRFMAGSSAIGEEQQQPQQHSAGAHALEADADPPASSSENLLSRQPMTDTLFNCLAAICNLSAINPEDVRAAHDVPKPTPDPAAAAAAAAAASPADAAPPPLEPGLVALLVTLSPSVVGSARCLVLTSLFNFSTHRAHRERLIEEGGVAATLALMAPELQRLRGSASVSIPEEEVTTYAQHGGAASPRRHTGGSSEPSSTARSAGLLDPIDIFAAPSERSRAARWTGPTSPGTPSRIAKPRSRGGARVASALVSQGAAEAPKPLVVAKGVDGEEGGEEEYALEEWDDDLGSPAKTLLPKPMDDADDDVGAVTGTGKSDDEDAYDSGDDDADSCELMLAAVSTLRTFGQSNPNAPEKGTNVRRRMQLLLRRLQRTQANMMRRASHGNIRRASLSNFKAAGSFAAAAGDESLFRQGAWTVPADSSADATLLLEDVYCMQVGVKILCNLSGCPAGIDSMLELSSIQVRKLTCACAGMRYTQTTLPCRLSAPSGAG